MNAIDTSTPTMPATSSNASNMRGSANHTSGKTPITASAIIIGAVLV